MNLGIFSGTFDPVHMGHIDLAKKALEQANLSRVVFMPESSPRRKTNVSPLKDRIAMLELSLDNEPRAEVFQSSGESHSVAQTMVEVQEHYGKDNLFYFIMGADVFEFISSWSGYKHFIKDNSLIVGLRSEDDGETTVNVASELDINPMMIDSPWPALSSSSLRANLQQEGLAPSTRKYILDNKLYE